MIILKTIIRCLSEQLTISDLDFYNFVGISKAQWAKYEASDMGPPLYALSKFCMLSNISTAQLFQIESLVSRRLNISFYDNDLSPETINRIYWRCKQYLNENDTRKSRNNRAEKYLADHDAITLQVIKEETVDLNIPAYLRRPLSGETDD